MHQTAQGTTLEVSNWERSETYRPNALVRPSTAEEIVAIVKDTARYPSPVRAAGSMHSPARCNGDNGGTLVDMRGMSRIIEITSEFVTVEAGAEYIDVAEALRERDLQFFVNTEIGNITMGAAACTATKDSSFPNPEILGQVGSYVTGVRLVAPDGTIRALTQQADPEEMRLIRSSYGLLGIIFEVTMRVKPLTAQSVRHVNLTVDQFEAALPGFIADEYAIMMYFHPHADMITVELRKEVPEQPPRMQWRWRLRNAFWRKWGPFIALTIKRIAPTSGIRSALEHYHLRVIRRALRLLVHGTHSWPDAQIVRYPHDPGRVRYVFSMWAFDEAGFPDLLRKYFAFCQDYYKRTGFKCDLPHVGYRIAKDNNAHFSYSQDSTVMSLDPVSTGGERWHEFLRVYNDFCSEAGGSPLFNQTKFLTPEHVRRSFGDRVEVFAAARRKCDPQGRFLDSHFADLLSEKIESQPQAAKGELTAAQ